MLYIVLARYAGLDAVYARNYESPGHAIARVHCPGRTIDVDTTKDGPTGFDRKDTYSDFLEVSESSLDELVNRNRRCDAPSDSCHSEPEEMPDQVFTGPYFHHESHYQVPQVRGSQMVRPGSRCQDFMMFLAAASLILPWIHSISDELRLRSSNARPVLVSVAARPYVDAARDLASKGRGGGLRYFGLWKKKFDFDGDGVLGRYEASAMYDELLGSEDR